MNVGANKMGEQIYVAGQVNQVYPKCDFNCGRNGVEVLELRDNQTGKLLTLTLCFEHAAEVRANANQKAMCDCGCGRAVDYCETNP